MNVLTALQVHLRALIKTGLKSRNFLNKRKRSVNSYEKGKPSLRQRDF